MFSAFSAVKGFCSWMSKYLPQQPRAFNRRARRGFAELAEKIQMMFLSDYHKGCEVPRMKSGLHHKNSISLDFSFP
jgi:dihydrodipicolinate synthase/N-acetylneuraminate lyase